jgi:hypothetical protein
MLGYESERRLKNFLVAIGDGEHQLERARQRLCEIRDMAPFQLFQRLDRDSNDSITSRELLNFIRDNGVFGIGEPECYELVKFFDSNEDGRLTY